MATIFNLPAQCCWGCLHLCYVKSDATACGSERCHHHELVRHLHGTINVDQHGSAWSDSVPGKFLLARVCTPVGWRVAVR